VPPPPNKTGRVIAGLSYIIAVFTAWHYVAGIKLHHSLSHALCHLKPPPPNTDVASGHPKLLQLETPLSIHTHAYSAV